MVQRDLGQGALEAEAALGRGAAEALVLIDDDDALGRPAQRDGPLDQPVLTISGFLVFKDLLRS